MHTFERRIYNELELRAEFPKVLHRNILLALRAANSSTVFSKSNRFVIERSIERMAKFISLSYAIVELK